MQRVPEDQRRRRHDRDRGAGRPRSRRRWRTAATRSASPPARCYTDRRARVRRDARPTSARWSSPPRITRRSSTSRSRTALDILCEKPIADTMAASLRIARKVRAAGRKMAVTMSHRFDQDKTTLRRDRALGRARPHQRDRHALPGRHAPAHGVELAVPPSDAGSAADRGRDPSPRHHRRPRRRALRDAVRVDLEAGAGPSTRATPTRS